MLRSVSATFVFAFFPSVVVAAETLDLELERASARALGFLATEVPAWTKSHKCFSCHNNAEAARALFLARKLGHSVAESSVAETVGFLSDPARWDKNGTDGEFSDKRLARLEFTVALAGLSEVDESPSITAALRSAAETIARDQAEDGSWKLDDVESIGSPATYGTPLATALALTSLRRSGLESVARSISRGEAYLRALPVNNTLEAAAIAIGLQESSRENAGAFRRSRDYLIRARTSEGAWGPYPRTPAEVFDTALGLIALSTAQERTAEIEKARGTALVYLMKEQGPDGSWPETTRPSGAVSYAQRLSTAGWATRALLMNHGRRM